MEGDQTTFLYCLRSIHAHGKPLRLRLTRIPKTPWQTVCRQNHSPKKVPLANGHNATTHC